LKRSIGETKKRWQDKNTRKEHLEEGNCWEDSWQRSYLDGWIRDMTKKTGVG